MSRQSTPALGLLFLATFLMPVFGAWLAHTHPLLRCGWFLAAIVMPIVFGTILIYRYAWHSPSLATMLASALLGSVFFQAALSGMLMDPRASQYSWQYLLLISAIVGLGAFVISLVVGRGGGTMIRRIREDTE